MASWNRKEDPGPYETAELVISGIIPIALIVIGTLGNLTSIFILLRKENRRTSTNVYLLMLCLMDTISLYQWNLNNIPVTFTHGKNQIWGGSLIHCRLSEFFSFYSLHTSAMFLTFVELDRACLLRSSWYKRKIAQPRMAWTLCVVILVVLFALNGFLFGLGVELTYPDAATGQQQVTLACFYTLNAGLMDFFANQYPWIHLVVMYFLPFTCIIFCTLFTVKKLFIRQTIDNEQLAISAQRNRRISIMLLLMCLTYVVSTLPNRLCFSVFADQIIGHDYTDTVFLATNTLMYTRNAMNAFFLYLSVHGYRRDLRSLVLRCLGKQSLQVAPAITVTTIREAGRITIIGQPGIK